MQNTKGETTQSPYTSHISRTGNKCTHMSRNCTARNRFFLGVFRCSAWHHVCELLRPIRHTAGNIAAEWSGRSPFSLGVTAVCLLKLPGKTLPMFGSSALDDCLLFGKQCLGRSLPMFGSTVILECILRPLWALPTIRVLCHPQTQSLLVHFGSEVDAHDVYCICGRCGS